MSQEYHHCVGMPFFFNMPYNLNMCYVFIRTPEVESILGASNAAIRTGPGAFQGQPQWRCGLGPIKAFNVDHDFE